jgi:hypothetical protein
LHTLLSPACLLDLCLSPRLARRHRIHSLPPMYLRAARKLDPIAQPRALAPVLRWRPPELLFTFSSLTSLARRAYCCLILARVGAMHT